MSIPKVRRTRDKLKYEQNFTETVTDTDSMTGSVTVSPSGNFVRAKTQERLDRFPDETLLRRDSVETGNRDKFKNQTDDERRPNGKTRGFGIEAPVNQLTMTHSQQDCVDVN